MEKNPYGGLFQRLGYEFKNIELITEALTHRSHHHEKGDSLHNERLEFLGDAVLDLSITNALMTLLPEASEGALSKIRASLVSEKTLAEVALMKLDLGSELRLGKGEEQSGGRTRPSLLADAYEAVIAAIYLDGGFEKADAFIRDSLAEFLDQLSRDTNPYLLKDYKSTLQEMCQRLLLSAPKYQCVETEGLDHERSFIMAAFIQGVELGRSSGKTKKIASQKLAQEILEKNDADLLKLKKFLASKNIKFEIKYRVLDKKSSEAQKESAQS